MVDGSLTCHSEDCPRQDLQVDFSCPASASSASDCSTCTIVSDDNASQCNSGTICSDNIVAYDCSNIVEGDCVALVCNENCLSRSQEVITRLPVKTRHQLPDLVQLPPMAHHPGPEPGSTPTPTDPSTSSPGHEPADLMSTRSSN
jgi:hypothetical protein